MAHRAPASPKSMAKFPMANETKVVNLMPTPDNFARTGISGLDSILEGGIPRSNVTLVEGAIGTGKTTMGVEFVYRGASEFDEPGLIVLFEVSPEKVVLVELACPAIDELDPHGGRVRLSRGKRVRRARPYRALRG